MGSSQPAIKVVIIDLRGKPEDFTVITKADGFACNYYDSYDTFIQNQSLKELSYIIIREKEQQQDIELNQKIRQSSVIAKTYRNMRDLQREFSNSAAKNEVLLRERLITYIRKYSLERLVIYLLVENVLNFKLAEYEQPYITLIADNVEVIKQHLSGKPKGAEPAIFKFRRLVKDLYRRTVVKVLSTEVDEEVAKKNKKEWADQLGSKITMSFSNFNEQQFQEGLISNYYDYIVVDSGKALTFIQDMKKVHKFESELIYFGNIDDCCKDAQGQQNESKLNEIKSTLWTYSTTIAFITSAIKDCTDIKVEQTEIVARNVVVYTFLNYGTENEKYIVKQLLGQLEQLLSQQKSSEPKVKRLKSKDIQQKGWYNKMEINIVSNLDELKQKFKKTPFSYLITFDCSTEQIEKVKAQLRLSKYDKRVYMYNAEEDPTVIQRISKKLLDTTAVRQYLFQRVQKVVEKAGFRIKFEIGHIDEITTYKLGEKEAAFFSNEMGLLTSRINSRQDFKRYYLSSNRERIIAGFCMVLRVQDYLQQWKKFLEDDTSEDPLSYFSKVKIVILDDKNSIKHHWKQIKEGIQTDNIAFVHYNLARVREFLEIMSTPRINLTIFVKKALPKFYKAYQKLIEYKFKRIELTASIVSKSSLLKEVFEDDNFKLSKHHRLSFLKLSNTSKNIQESLTILHQQFLLRYGTMWKTGYEVVAKDKRSSLESLRENIKLCLYKCKAYSLLNVSEEQFEYFYLDKLDHCKTYLDLHITMIYLFSLPHGLANVIQLIFSDPLSTCLTPKLFVSFVVALLVCFCSFQDEVMKKKRFLVYMDDTNKQQFLGVMKGLKRGDVLFNNCFLFAGTDQGSPDNASNNCLFLEFEDIPMLSDTHIKQYLHMEPFSFYKESTEYLIAPYTQFTVKNIENNINGKIHVTLGAAANSKHGFVAKVFQANQIKQETLFQIVVGEVSMLKSSFTESDHQRIKEIRSLYKKAQLIALYEQKLELMKSIKEGLQYKRFIQAMRNKKVLQALSHLKKKEQSQKSTTQLQAAYFKKMLGVEKALLYYTLCEYDISMNELEKVLKYLTEQNVQSTQNWLIKKVKSYQQNVNDLNTKRHKYLNRFEKTKHWKIEAHQAKDSKKIGVSLTSNKMQWKVGYNSNLQQFYIEGSKDKYYYYNILPAFGETATAFPNNSAYQTLSQRQNHGQATDLSQIKNTTQPQNSKQRLPKSPKNANQLQSQVRPLVVRDQSRSKPEHSFKDLEAKREVSSDWLFKTDNTKAQQPVKELPMKSRVLEESKSKLSKVEQITSFEFLPEGESNLKLSESEISMGVSKQVTWQAFFFDGKFVLQQKGKHFKMKVPNKHHF